jgi:hypothetical protein
MKGYLSVTCGNCFLKNSFARTFLADILIFATLNYARVAKLVDALSSGGSIRKVVLVRIQSRAQ